MEKGGSDKRKGGGRGGRGAWGEGRSPTRKEPKETGYTQFAPMCSDLFPYSQTASSGETREMLALFVATQSATTAVWVCLTGKEGSSKT